MEVKAEPTPPALQPVWGRAVRLLHWALVGALAVAAAGLWWLPGLHQPAGYLALAAVLARALWGLCAPAGSPTARHARFTQFVRAPGATLAYLRLLRRGREPRYIGHNPLGGWMVLALMGCVAGLAVSGWLYTTDVLWGDETVEGVHRALAGLLLALVVLHLTGVAVTSLRHRENLVSAMFTGRKRAAAADDEP